MGFNSGFKGLTYFLSSNEISLITDEVKSA